MRLNGRERSATGIVLQAGAVLIISPVAPAVSSAGHTRRNLAVEVPVTNHPRVEDPEDLVPLTVVLAHAPVGNLEIGFVVGQDVMSTTSLVGWNAINFQ